MTQSPEERKRRSNAASLRWHQENTPGPGVIGEVKPLAPGAINPMWAIEAGIEETALQGLEILEATKPKQTLKKNVSVEGEGLYLTRTIEVDPLNDL